MGFDYYYGMEAEQFAFYRIPRILIKDERFKVLSSDAKILYGLMLDRMSLSMRNGWIDEYNRVYIYYTVDEVIEDLGCTKGTVAKIFAELDCKKGIGLIEKKRQGQGKPDCIYVKNFISLEAETEKTKEKCRNNSAKSVDGDSMIVSEVQNLDFKKSKNHTSRSPKIEPLEVQNLDANKNYNNKTDINNNNLVLSCPSEKDRQNEIKQKGFCDVEAILKKNIAYDDLKIVHADDMKLIDEFVDIMLDVFCSKGEYVYINGEQKLREIVKRAIMKLRYTHIEQVLWNFEAYDKPIKRKRQYILTMLYNVSMEQNIGLNNSIHADLGY